MTFRRALALDDLWSGDMRSCAVAGRRVLLIRLDENASDASHASRASPTVYAYEDRCAHLGVPLSQGRLDGDRLTCRAHEWVYDARSGQGINPRSACLVTFPVKIQGGDILVDVQEGGARSTPEATDLVGPVLAAGDTACAIVEAVRSLNANVSIQDRGSYLRVLVPRRCVVTRRAIEDALGTPFRLPGDLELVMPSFKGTFRVDDGEAVWTLGPDDSVRDGKAAGQ